MNSSELLALLLLTAFAGGLVQGLAGFGFGMVAMALYALALDVREAVPLVSILGVLVGLTVLIRWWKHVSWSEVWPLLMGGALGIPLGVAYLTSVDERPLQGTLGALLVVYAIWSLLRQTSGDPSAEPPPAGVASRLWGALAGWLGGVAGGAFNMGGPPVVVYSLVRRWEQGVFVGSLQAYFVVMTSFQLTLLVNAGLATQETVSFAALSFPALVAGVLLGGRLSRRLNPVAFRRVVYALLIVLGGSLLRRAFV